MNFHDVPLKRVLYSPGFSGSKKKTREKCVISVGIYSNNVKSCSKWSHVEILFRINSFTHNLPHEDCRVAEKFSERPSLHLNQAYSEYVAERGLSKNGRNRRANELILFCLKNIALKYSHLVRYSAKILPPSLFLINIFHITYV